MKKTNHSNLTRRGRQIMDILYRRGSAHAGEVMEELPGRPGYSAVRAQLRVLEEKGYVRHEERGLRYVYKPAAPRQQARRSALRHLIDTFFEGSRGKVMVALLGDETTKFTETELDELAELLKKAKKGGRL